MFFLKIKVQLTNYSLNTVTSTVQYGQQERTH